ncbi:hypothetical protein [Aliihoeflea sp. 2WW]|uniref:hypothetical protein n=1 Tax=Aliihoeflea sp. 2WW TaxID=1381123 RepID=UPI000467135C|nr:hypothetical protein [Aliihoeflea sp. 2WW]
MKRKQYPFEGERLTLSVIAKRTGMNAGTLYSRVNYYGMSVQDAVSRPITPRHLSNPIGKPARRHLFKGEMLTVAEVAARVGVKVQTLRYRMAQHGVSLDEAVTQSSAIHPTRWLAPSQPSSSQMLIAERQQRLRNRYLIRRMAGVFAKVEA